MEVCDVRVCVCFECDIDVMFRSLHVLEFLNLQLQEVLGYSLAHAYRCTFLTYVAECVQNKHLMYMIIQIRYKLLLYTSISLHFIWLISCIIQF